MDHFMQAALDAAKRSLSEGGIQIGSVLSCDGEFIVLGCHHDRRLDLVNIADALNDSTELAISFGWVLIYSIERLVCDCQC